jgi:CDGSH iron-sulfur domain-containing protein 3
MADPVIANRAPFAVDVVAGQTYWWCSCGRSKRQPFCDGTHNPTQFKPVRFVAERTGQVWFCGCKHTKKAPKCDGTHWSLRPPAKDQTG